MYVRSIPYLMPACLWINVQYGVGSMLLLLLR